MSARSTLQETRASILGALAGRSARAWNRPCHRGLFGSRRPLTSNGTGIPDPLAERPPKVSRNLRQRSLTKIREISDAMS